MPPLDPNQYNKALSKASSSVSGALSLYGTGRDMINQAKSINTTAPESSFDSIGRPLYNLADFNQYVNSIKPSGAGAGEIASGTLSGASAGASFGPWGAAIGGVLGGVSSALFGNRRKTLMARKREQAKKSLASAQQFYNTSIENFNNSQSARDLYSNTIEDNFSQARANNISAAL